MQKLFLNKIQIFGLTLSITLLWKYNTFFMFKQQLTVHLLNARSMHSSRKFQTITTKHTTPTTIKYIDRKYIRIKNANKINDSE